jgi:arylsulfatase
MTSHEPFHGRIGRTWRDSQPWRQPEPAAPAGAPNILFIVLDDVGYSDLGCYGSEIETPRMDALAQGGLRYSNFHVTAMCSPTRASLLTGRNAHAVGMGSIAEWSTGFPGYQGRITPHAATVAQMLAKTGYGTYAVGKWHLANMGDYPTGGSREHWPLGKGFNRWYGFLGGFIDHWNPDLHEDNHPVQRPPKEGYHLSEDLVDRAIGFVRDHVTSAGTRPWLTYLALGAGHWPLHVPQQWIAKYKGRYDAGWDAVREQRLARQKAMGLLPADTPLAPANPTVRAWDSLAPDERALCARLQETYAGFLSHADAQIGRLVDYLDETGQLANTAIVLLSDNGASGEGGPTGAVNIRRHMAMERETVQYGLERLDQIGSEYSFPHYPMGWAQASNTPLKWFKRNTHGGGIRAPLVVHWPARIEGNDAIRHQYHHVSDIVPTLLDALKVPVPSVYEGHEQMPLHGTSMLYSFDQANAATRKETQHFEMVGDRAIWHRGWKAVARHTKGEDFDADRWELYHLDEDFAEIDDLADVHPEKLQALVALWWTEAERYGVLPLDDRDVERSLAWSRNEVPRHFELQPGMARFDRQLVPPINDRSWQLRAKLQVASPNAYGIVLACGSRFAGYQLHCSGAKAVFTYAVHESLVHRLEAPLPQGEAMVEVVFTRSGERAGEFALRVNGVPADSARVARTWNVFGMSGGMTCGFGNVPITDECLPPAALTGLRLHGVVVDVAADSSGDADDYAAALREQ